VRGVTRETCGLDTCDRDAGAYGGGRRGFGGENFK
jgi:hypothetical protein